MRWYKIWSAAEVHLLYRLIIILCRSYPVDAGRNDYVTFTYGQLTVDLRRCMLHKSIFCKPSSTILRSSFYYTSTLLPASTKQGEQAHSEQNLAARSNGGLSCKSDFEFLTDFRGLGICPLLLRKIGCTLARWFEIKGAQRMLNRETHDFEFVWMSSSNLNEFKRNRSDESMPPPPRNFVYHNIFLHAYVLPP